MRRLEAKVDRNNYVDVLAFATFHDLPRLRNAIELRYVRPELADYSRRALVYDMDKLKRPASDMRARMDYVKRINGRWGVEA